LVRTCQALASSIPKGTTRLAPLGHTPAVSAVLPTQADKPRYVAAMFGRIARRYDLMNTLMTAGHDRRWRQLVSEVAVSGSPERVLDVGTGTGRLGDAIRKANPHAQVVGIDFTQEMLRFAPRAIRPTRADALHLPFGDEQFDVVVSAFLVRNLADVSRGVAEQVRVLRHGGRLVVLETTPGPSNPVLRPLVRLYFRGIVPLLGGLIAGDPSAYTYLPESTQAFLEPARLAHILSACGLCEVTVRRLALGSVALTAGRKPAG
jgi:demethylmenaquinone methyltransferase / 2-methoxy-6-polyprenyl-1,4-benzoquinol methylase